MLSLLKKLTASAPAAVTPETPPLAKVDPFMLGLQDAMLSGWFNQENGELFTGFPVTAEDTLLDVGCGDGGNVHYCAMRGAKIIVADIDAAKIEATRQRLSDTRPVASNAMSPTATRCRSPTVLPAAWCPPKSSSMWTTRRSFSPSWCGSASQARCTC